MIVLLIYGFIYSITDASLANQAPADDVTVMWW